MIGVDLLESRIDCSGCFFGEWVGKLPEQMEVNKLVGYSRKARDKNSLT